MAGLQPYRAAHDVCLRSRATSDVARSVNHVAYPRALMMSGLLLALAVCGGQVQDDAGGGGSSGVGTTNSTAMGTSSGTGMTEFGACSQPGTCILADRTCCGVCGKPELTDFDAVALPSVDAHREAVCPEQLLCPGCPEEPNGNLFAYCDLAAGSCRGADIGASPYSECAVAGDCTLRLGLDCCTCGAAGPWVAVANKKLGELAALVCAADHVCSECEPAAPANLSAACVKGQCAVVEVMTP